MVMIMRHILHVVLFTLAIVNQFGFNSTKPTSDHDNITTTLVNSSTQIANDQVHDNTISALASSSPNISLHNGINGTETNRTTDVATALLPLAGEDNDAVKPNEIDESKSEYRRTYAKQMLTYMNHSVDPCNDFYEYACGNWRNVITERQARHKRNNLLDIVYTLADFAEQILTTTLSDDDETRYGPELRLAQQFYNACLVADLYPMKRSDDYLQVLRQIGGFPAVDGDRWQPDEFSWFNMSAHMTNYGALGLIQEEQLPQYPFPPYFKLPGLGFELIVHSDNIATNTTHGYLMNEQRMRGYLAMYGVEPARADQIIGDIFEFWHAVLDVMDTFSDDMVKCAHMSANYTFERWDDFFQIAWRGIEFDVEADDCPCNYFYVKLDEICEERKEAVANYLAMKFLYRMDARLRQDKFQKNFCIVTVSNAVPFLVDQLYMKKFFPAETKSEIALIIGQIRESLRIVLNEASWLDDDTRSEALLKESTIQTRIGSFDNPNLIVRLINEMSNLTFVDGNFELNYLNMIRFRTFMRRYIGLHYKEFDESAKPLELLNGMQVNAFYYNVDNSINVMAGILHPPAYHREWPSSLKFGTIGYLIGHEFTHGFDSVGSNYDSLGAERYWWTEKSEAVFKQRSACYVDHYNGYRIPQINRNINGNETLDENLADSGGLRESLMAYRRYMKTQDANVLHEEQMPGLDLAPEQLFFLGFAQLWCAAYEEEHYWEELTDEHTVDKYRVLGAVSNIAEFSEAYNCPVGSQMNPKTEKCRLW